jgi:hypothetical protein
LAYFRSAPKTSFHNPSLRQLLRQRRSLRQSGVDDAGAVLRDFGRRQDLFANVKSGKPEVAKISDGSLKGYATNGISASLGIPFAAPPVGELRWKRPRRLPRRRRGAASYAR